MVHENPRIEPLETVLADIHRLTPFYGSDATLLHNRQKKILHLIHQFKESYPQEQIHAVCRIPGRINLMGVHIDHRGGWCNYQSIAREMFFCISPRQDDTIVACNVSPSYPTCTFSIGTDFPPSCRGSWLDYIESVSLPKGEWGNYLKAGAFKLQDAFPDIPLCGMNVMVDGDIPCRSGLSSSSTLVVGTVLALKHLNQLPGTDHEWVELCGEGEWFVGTRGGAGDHAALLLGKAGHITHVGFHPLHARHFTFPGDHDVLIVQSGIQADKATHARQTFNTRIASYEIAFELYKYHHPEYSPRLAYLRDIDFRHLEIPLHTFYQSLKAIPVHITRDDLYTHYAALHDSWDRIFHIYGDPLHPLPLREVLLFGIFECDRARRFPELMEKGHVQQAGRLMNISHNGDRITTWREVASQPYRSPYDDAYLDELSRVARLSPAEDHVQPCYQPGGYRCSVPELDRLVDYCQALQGVVGAGLTGAGLGGSILVLVKSRETEHVIIQLQDFLSTWDAGDSRVEKCCSVAGASLIWR